MDLTPSTGGTVGGNSPATELQERNAVNTQKAEESIQVVAMHAMAMHGSSVAPGRPVQYGTLPLNSGLAQTSRAPDMFADVYRTATSGGGAGHSVSPERQQGQHQGQQAGISTAVAPAPQLSDVPRIHVVHMGAEPTTTKPLDAGMQTAQAVGGAQGPSADLPCNTSLGRMSLKDRLFMKRRSFKATGNAGKKLGTVSASPVSRLPLLDNPLLTHDDDDDEELDESDVQVLEEVRLIEELEDAQGNSAGVGGGAGHSKPGEGANTSTNATPLPPVSPFMAAAAVPPPPQHPDTAAPSVQRPQWKQELAGGTGGVGAPGGGLGTGGGGDGRPDDGDPPPPRPPSRVHRQAQAVAAAEENLSAYKKNVK